MVIYSHDIMKVGKVKKNPIYFELVEDCMLQVFVPNFFCLYLSISHKSIIEFISFINKHFCLINVTFLSLIFSHFFILTWPGIHVVYYMVCISELEDYCTYKILKLSRNRICTSAIFLESCIYQREK